MTRADRSDEIPAHGGRVDLTLERFDEREVVYRATLASAGQRAEGTATVSLAAGVVTLSLSPEPPAFLAAFATAFLRSAWLARRDDPEPWPSRITRWRAAK